mmetsp:Transcript_23893/g.34950  ORF Transcript_23893/g.34950 Transcript_23893/m.34950 type:complete len:132 (-) Transcript_23893:103-498(-)|eukprot:CAMPEP_0195521730 /NCGR_PEP_ID=MMETSP0794_2-20130614/19246_1 /TAXON_ID=515487 /ORGANISM="Stephanopyxis turris, Strain CCMP 815" /LENGTH=131 /DNA_ID=CAMNT_0040651343 /DNA_START=142 /DNA_END=537 /DNA_ORIENTATION=-
MVHGRAGMRLEALKFAIYLSIPIVASGMFNDPKTIQGFVEYYNYISYPPEDPETTKMKNDLESLRKNLEQQQRKRMIMQSQLRSLDSMVDESSSSVENTVTKQDPSSSKEVDGGDKGWKAGTWFRRGQKEA